MKKPRVTYDTVRELGLALPGAEESTSYGTPALKVKGKLFVRLHQDLDKIVLPVPFERREEMMAADPETYLITDHDREYPYILVSLARVQPDALPDLLNLAYRTGVKIALGTDSAVAPHSEANKEVELMVTKGGMTPRDALIAATKGGPDLMNLSSETGTLEAGKSADLIAVEGDPLVDPRAVQHVDYVMVRGTPIPMKGQ